MGLKLYSEVLDQARNITDAIKIPLIVDGDTGYGNAMNTCRSVQGFAKAGCAGVLIEHQLAPQCCRHSREKTLLAAKKPLIE